MINSDLAASIAADPAPRAAAKADNSPLVPAVRTRRICPKVVFGENSATVQVLETEPFQLAGLFGLKTNEAAEAVLQSALTCLGKAGINYRPLVTALAAEIEPTDAVEALLVVQMMATHMAITAFSGRAADATNPQARESFERSLTRLSRTYLAQMDTLKRHRTGGQQKVTVEHVHVHSGGQAIVGSVQHGGEGGK